MKNAILVFVAAAGFLGFLLASNSLEFSGGLFQALYPKHRSYAIEPSLMPDEILIKFKKTISEDTKTAILNSNGLRVVNVIPKIGVDKIKVEAKLRERVLDTLRNDPSIEFAEPNFLTQSLVVPKIPDSQVLDIPTGLTSVVVGVVDTGLKSYHGEFEGKMVPGFNTFLDNTDTSDPVGHGTAVAVIASAAWQNPIMPIRDTDNTGLSPYADMAEAIIYAADHGAKVINISQEGVNSSATVQSAIDYAWNLGAVIVAAAGDIENSTCSNCIKFPASAENVLAVGAIDGSDNSSWEATSPDGIKKTYYSARGLELDFVASGFGFGTELAAPNVAGLVSLIWSANPSLSNSQVIDVIKNSADDLGTPGWDDKYGWGRVNATKALEKAK